MSRKVEIDCLKRYQSFLGLSELIEFLRNEKLVNDETFKDLSRQTDYPERVHKILDEAQKSDNVQLLSYDWVILPVERIKITITTERQHKEFSYDSPNV